MGLFRRKKKPVAAPAPMPTPKSPCEIWGHLWQDFPWILQDEYNPSRASASHIEITETYICHICGKEKKVMLFSEYENLSRKAHDAKVERLMEQFKNHIKPVPIVMDMINDMRLLDRERLAAWNRLHDNTPAEKQPLQLKLGDEVFDIK